MHISKILAVLAFSSFLVSSPSLAEDGPYFVVTAEGLSCVASHVGDYSISEGETLFVSLINCNQDSTGQLSLIEMVQNSAPDISVATEDGPDTVVALSPEDLACIETLAVPLNGELFTFYPIGCRLVQR